ncbi:MAG: tetratricopeptide repeat protein [Sulfitobacter sp.]
MEKKILHAGNIGVAFATVAQAADVTLTMGAGTAITSALAALEIFKKATPEDKAMARQMAEAAQAHLHASHLQGDRRKIVIQMMAIYPPDLTEMAKGNMEAATVAANICDQIRRTGTDTEHRGDTALHDYGTFLTAVLDPLLEPATPMEAMQQELLRRSEVSGEAQRLRDAGIDEKALINLAKRIGGDAQDLKSAWAELQNAMEIAERVQKDGHASSNHGDFVDQVMQRVTELAAVGEYDDASAKIAEALAEEEAAFAARKLRLLGRDIDMAMLAGNSALAARRLVEKADVDAGGTAAFEDLRMLQGHYYETGRDKGIALDLEVAIDLAQLVRARAATADERGAAQNGLGMALAIIGERENSTVRLEQARAAFEAAIQECTQDRVPLDWAKTQNNLGNVLVTLGERESSTARLEQAVAAYEAALQERTQDRAPLSWAMTQNNLGTVLQTLGEREYGTARLERAVVAYQAALQEWTQDRVPLDWAGTQSNLGNVLKTLGERESDAERLEQAVTAYQAALQEWTQERVPVNWAMTQNNLGNVLVTLGERESSTARLEQAVVAYEAALLERTQDRAPLSWAMTQNNLGTALKALGARESGTAQLEQAVAAFEAALQERTKERVPLNWAFTQGNLCNVALLYFDKTNDAAHLDQAQAYVESALEVFVDAEATHYQAMAQKQLDQIAALRDAL